MLYGTKAVLKTGLLDRSDSFTNPKTIENQKYSLCINN